MGTNAKQIRDRFRELLDDGLPHSRKELFAYAKEDMEENAYTDSMLAGALKTLVDSSNIYCCIERGIYQKVELSGKPSDDIISHYIVIFKRALDKANREKIDPMALLEMSEEEKQKMKEIQECLLSIEETVERLELLEHKEKSEKIDFLKENI